jgi:hypothetical protein
MEIFSVMKKTITIDAKQYKAAFKNLRGTGTAYSDYTLARRSGMNDLDWAIKKLSTGWTFDGQWKAPEKDTKP